VFEGSIDVKLIENKPYKHIFGDCPWQWCASSPRSEKPKVVTMVTHLANRGLSFRVVYGPFFCF